MIDGITIKSLIINFEAWKVSINITFTNIVDTYTGEVLTKKRFDKIITTQWAKWETFDLIVKEVLNTSTGKSIFHLTLKGSLHKNNYGGSNYLPFTRQQLHQQVNHICKTLFINPTTSQISTLEIGVNVITPFIVSPFLMQNIVNYKGDPFTRYKKDNNGFCLGIYCSLTQSVIKIYDKGLQYLLPNNLMRFEKRFLKMQVLNKLGIKFLSDLLHEDKVKNLLPMLIEAWQNVLIFDIDDLKNISKKCNFKEEEIDLLRSGQNPKYWERLKEENKRQYNYQREKFKRLVATNGNNWQQRVKGLIQNEWQNLFKNCINLHSGEIDKLYKLTIKIKGKNVQTLFCQSCGNDISNQKDCSKFCSPKFVGEAAAHHCRNNNSNPRNNLKNKIKRITARGLLFDITPYFINVSSK
jgi:hypothetical protein